MTSTLAYFGFKVPGSVTPPKLLSLEGTGSRLSEFELWLQRAVCGPLRAPPCTCRCAPSRLLQASADGRGEPAVRKHQSGGSAAGVRIILADEISSFFVFVCKKLSTCPKVARELLESSI